MIRITLVLLVSSIIPTARAQEPSYSEDRIAPSRVPAAFRKAAEKEVPGVGFAIVYRDNEKGYRFVGQGSDGRTVSVKFDREGKLVSRRIGADVAAAKVPKAVTSALQAEIKNNSALAGFQASRTTPWSSGSTP